MPGPYSDIFSNWNTQGAPVSIMDMGGSGLPDLSRMPGGGGLGDILAGFNADANKFTTKDMLNTGLTGLQTIGGLVGAFGSLGLAKKQFGLSKRMAETNLANQIGAYNTALDDKARSRAVVEGQSPEQVAAYIDKNRARG